MARRFESDFERDLERDLADETSAPDGAASLRGGEALARLLEKMVEVSGSLDSIERWLDGEEPADLALGLANDFSVARRGPLSLESVSRIARGRR